MAMNETPKRGRPSLYSDAIGAEICERIAKGSSLASICKDEEMPNVRTVIRWLSDEANEKFAHFRRDYARAKEAQADALADEILEIADESANDSYVDDQGVTRTNQEVVARSRLRVDARKWIAAKLKPRVYGERVLQEVSGPGGGPVQQVNMTLDEFRQAAKDIASEI